MQWLRSTFESVVGAPSMEQTYLYKQYVATCSKNPARQVLAAVQFYSCVRYETQFGSLG
jgi:RFX DNA-binding domain